MANSGSEIVRWERVNGYLQEFGIIPTCGDGYIPENIFYRLAMKVKNEAAERFQAFVANEALPSIRKHGRYITTERMETMLNDPDT
jgi:anti-repressor protein